MIKVLKKLGEDYYLLWVWCKWAYKVRVPRKGSLGGKER